eukprot:CAMPEP_0174703386 /NCGR_PEP_ID=MMETSP1094-20130205/7352_1 /TAXON_ID=156173 /ORGANISM="Chrysochromulina brevifilum, Strain UTEX LB 985" /LENGTH=164 /DNA_ID=CAMNT_0015901307 /DNA_START=1309 /DNA_END=1804 /DNA_ORIENTATION=-
MRRCASKRRGQIPARREGGGAGGDGGPGAGGLGEGPAEKKLTCHLPAVPSCFTGPPFDQAPRAKMIPSMVSVMGTLMDDTSGSTVTLRKKTALERPLFVSDESMVMYCLGQTVGWTYPPAELRTSQTGEIVPVVWHMKISAFAMPALASGEARWLPMTIPPMQE